MFCLVASSLGHLRVQLSAAPLCKEGTGGLQSGRGDWRRLSAVECGRLVGTQGGPRPLVAMQALDQATPQYTSAVFEFAGGGSISVLRMRDLANAKEMNLGEPLVVEAAALAAVSASSLPDIPLCPSIHISVVGPGRALSSDHI